MIGWRYYIDAEQAWDKAHELATSWSDTYPGESLAWNSLGIAAAAFGDHQAAVRAFGEAIRLDPRFVPPHGNLAGSYIALNNFAEAKTLLADATQRGISFITVRRMSFLLALLAEDASAMGRELGLVRASNDVVWACVLEARAALFGGEVSAAHDAFQRAVQAAASTGASELAAQWAVEDAEGHALAEDCAAARPEIRAAPGIAPRQLHARARRAGAGAVRGHRTGDGAGDRTVGTVPGGHAHHAAAGAGHQGGPRTPARRCCRHPEAARPGDAFRPCAGGGVLAVISPRKAYLQLRDPTRAATQFQAILEHRGEAPTSPLYRLAQAGLAGVR